MLRDILRGDDPQITAVQDTIIQADADIIVVQDFDFDLRATALNAFADALAARGLSYPHRFTRPTNAGRQSGLDLNADGRLGDADDAQGYGRFYGAGGMAILSRFPIMENEVEDYTALLWRDLPDNIYPQVDGAPFGGAQVHAAQRLSSKGHWIVPVATPDHGTVRVMTFHAAPPVFDGVEDRNGRRNHDEAAFWLDYLARADSALPFVLLGVANMDPDRGQGRPEAIRALLTHPQLQDPFPDTPTADFDDPDPGDLRVDYLLPSSDWKVENFGTIRTPSASRHDLLWADLERRDP